MAFAQMFGDELLTGSGTAKTSEVLQGKYVGIYFSAHWCPPCRGFTPKLAEAYKNALKGKGLEIVFVSSDKDEGSFQEYFSEMPWKALPFADRERETALSKQFKVRGIPHFVILDQDGTLITADGRSEVSDDLSGEHFPWRPLPFSAALGNTFVGQGGATLTEAATSGKVLGLYFSAHWCPPCRQFTPQLADWYKAVCPTLPNFQIIFVSSDRSQEDFDQYFAEMPWIAVPWSDRARKEKLSKRFGVSGIPTFVIVDKDGNTITTKGRGIPSADPEGKQFPWHPKAVKEVSEDVEGLQENPSLVVFMDGSDAEAHQAVEAALEPLAKEFQTKAKDEGSDEVLFFIGKPASEGILSQLRRLAGLNQELEKHKHPLVKGKKENWYCDGCRKSGEEVAYTCADCNFDYCEDCNGKAKDHVQKPVVGVLFDFSQEASHVVQGVDFTDAAKVRATIEGFKSGSLTLKKLSS